MFFRQINSQSKKGGYIAVISAVIITAIVMVISAVFSSSNFLGRFDSQALEMKDLARGVAQGCLEYGRLKLALNPVYGGNETRGVGEYSCRLLPVTDQGNQYVLESQAIVGAATFDLRMVVDKITLKTISLQEMGSF